jgi:hypothetical protein
MNDRRQQDTLEQEEFVKDKENAEIEVSLFLYKAERGMVTTGDVIQARKLLRILGVNV